MKQQRTLTREALITEAGELTSEHGENTEYDRALAELIYWVAGGATVATVREEIRTAQQAHVARVASRRRFPAS